MTNTVLIKRSSAPGSVPSAGNLVAGELAINYADGKLYFLGSGGAVTQIAGNSSMTFSGNVSAGNILTGGLISAAGNITGGNANITGTTASTSKTTGALTVAGGLGVAGTAYNNRSVTQGAYGNIILNEFTGIYNQKDSGTSLIQTTTNALSAGLGIQVTGAAGNGSQLYSTGTMDIKVGVAVRSEDTPTGGTVVASVASTGLSVTGLVSATGNITGANFTMPSGTVLNSSGAFIASSAVTSQTVQVSANALGAGVAITTNGITGGLVSSGNIYFKVNTTLVANSNPTGGTVVADFNSDGLAITGTLTTTANVSTTGNVVGGNINTAGVMSASGNIVGGNVTTPGLLFATGNIIGGNLITTGAIGANGNIAGNYFIGNGSLLTGIAGSGNAFSTISVTGQSNVVANSAGVVSFVEGSGVTITTDNTTGTVTFSAAGGSTSIFATGGSMDLVTDAVTSSQDLGSILDVASSSYDLGTLIEARLVWPSQFKLPEYTVGTLPTASPAGLMVYVSNASSGAIPAFSDGSNWRRVDDRNIVT